MAVFRVHKSKNYTVMANHHLQHKELSLRARGLLSTILALPDNWNYSKAGLLKIISESEFILNETLDELKKFGYLKIEKHKPQNGSNRYTYTYNIYEVPRQDLNFQGLENQGLENQHLENQGLENYPLNKERNQSNTKELKTKRVNTKFIPPTLEEIKAYCKERNSTVDPVQFFEYFDEGKWIDSNGKKVKNWKQKLMTWEKFNTGARNNGDNRTSTNRGYIVGKPEPYGPGDIVI